MEMNHEKAVYLAAAITALADNPQSVAPWTSSTCSECREDVNDLTADDLHVSFMRDGGTLAVLIGCEGYWMINPSVIGLTAPNWDDWTQYQDAV